MKELCKFLIPMNKETYLTEGIKNILKKGSSVKLLLPDGKVYTDGNVKDKISDFFNKNPLLLNLDYKLEVIIRDNNVSISVIPDPKSA